VAHPPAVELLDIETRSARRVMMACLSVGRPDDGRKPRIASRSISTSRSFFLARRSSEFAARSLLTSRATLRTFVPLLRIAGGHGKTHGRGCGEGWRIEVCTQQRLSRLVPLEIYNEMIDSFAGMVRSEFAGLAAVCTHDITMRRIIEREVNARLRRIVEHALAQAIRLEAAS
jgi:hypothetical protein